MSMTPRLGRTLSGSVLLATLVLSGSAAANLTVVRCHRTINKEYVKYVKTITKVVQKCNDTAVKDGNSQNAPGGDLVGCDPDLKIGSALTKLEEKIADKCQVTPGDVDWPGTCPNFENGTCTNAIAHSADITTCLDCIARAAVKQAIDQYYLSLSDPAGDDDLIKCQRAIGKETSRFLLAKQSFIGKCRKAVDDGKATLPCPDASDAIGSPERRAADAITKAESKKVTNICKACDTDSLDGVTCTGAGLSPSTIGFASSCPAVIVPNGGPACGGPVTTLNELVACVDCVAEFKVDCMDALSRPDQASYPPECNAGTPMPTPTATASVTPTATATPTPSATPTVIGTPVPGCGNGVIDTGEDCDPAGGVATSCLTVSNTGAGFVCNGTTCQCACPGLVQFTGTAGSLGVLDIGWTGLTHDSQVVDEGTVSAGVTGCAGSSRPCGECTLLGPVDNPDADAGDIDNHRCTGNTRCKCATNADCAAAGCGGTCEYYSGSYLPLSAIVSVCIANQIDGTITGTVDVESGSAATSAHLIWKTYSGPTADNPCPKCLGDGTANDGVRGGTCGPTGLGGDNEGQSCDVNGTSPNPFFGSTSLDCPPPADSLITGQPAPIGGLFSTASTTGTVTRALSAASPNCRAAGFTSFKCLCDTCNNINFDACNQNADCPDSGRCNGGSNGGKRCVADSACPSGTCAGRPCTAGTECASGTCSSGFCSTLDGICGGTFGGRCTAGPNEGAPCSSGSQCPSAGCGGAPFGTAATNFNQCDDNVCSPTNTCVGGSNGGANCTAASECPGGMCAAGNEGVCAAGPFEQFCGPNGTFKGCEVDQDCASLNGCVGGSNPGADCVAGGPICTGGNNANAPCTLDSECPGSGNGCTFGCLGGGTCNSNVGGTAETCSVSKARECFLDNGLIGGSVTAAGIVDPPTNDEADPTVASLFCIPWIGSAGVASTRGLPGPGRLELPVHMVAQP